MKKSLLLLLILSAAALFVLTANCRQQELPSRQRETLDPADYRREAQFVREALELHERTPQNFSRLWANTGPAFHEAVEFLKENHPELDQPVEVHRFRGNPNELMLLYRLPDRPAVVVCVWNGGEKLKLTGLFPAREDSK